MSVTGRCLCAGVRFELRGEPTAMAYCHCTRCQRFGGGLHSTAVATTSEGLHVTEGSDLTRAYSEEGFADRVFCSRCGSSLYARLGDMVFVEAGTLEADPGLRPQFHMMVAYEVPWHEIDDDLPQFPEWPPMDG